MGLGAAVIGAGVIGAGAGIASGAMNASAVNKASKAQQAAAAAGIGEQQREFDTTQTNMAPWLQAGQAALSSQRDLLGLGGGTPDYASYVQNNPDLLAAYNAQAGGGSAWAPNGPSGQSMADFGKNYYQAYGHNGGETYGSPTTPTAADAQQGAITALQNSPLYQSLYRNGQNTILANASATGGLRGGNIQSSLANFGADTLSTVIQQQLANLGGISNAGSSTATNLGQLGQSNANAQSQLYGQSGSAQAGGILGSTGALTSGFAGAAGSALNGLGAYYGRQATLAGGAFPGQSTGLGADTSLNGLF